MTAYETDREDLMIEAALDYSRLPESAGQPPRREDADDDALLREYTELLGLIPNVLDPEQPSARLRRTVLATVGGREVSDLTLAQAVDASAPGALEADLGGDEIVDMTLMQTRPRASDESDAGDMTLAGRIPPVVEERPARLPGPRVAEPARSTSWVTWALAAMLGGCLLGLGYFVGQLNSRDEMIDTLRAGIDASEAEKVALEDRYADLRGDYQMIVEVAQQAYPMRPVADAEAYASEVEAADSDVAGPDGIVYVCGRHERWLLTVSGVEPPPTGQEYRLWFLTDEGQINGGSLQRASTQTPVFRARATFMPRGTHGFAVTLEDAAEGMEETSPRGPMVLLGEHSVAL